MSGAFKIEIDKIHPLNDRIVVERVKSEETTSGGIIIPESAQEKPFFGTVIAVGPGKMNEKGEIVPVRLKIGDKVMFTKWSGTEIPMGYEKENLLVMKEEDVLCVIK